MPIEPRLVESFASVWVRSVETSLWFVDVPSGLLLMGFTGTGGGIDMTEAPSERSGCWKAAGYIPGLKLPMSCGNPKAPGIWPIGLIGGGGCGIPGKKLPLLFI